MNNPVAGIVQVHESFIVIVDAHTGQCCFFAAFCCDLHRGIPLAGITTDLRHFKLFPLIAPGPWY